MPGIPLQKQIIYGPVFSRRLGRSLGINILPAEVKVCSFNCIYCQYAYTEGHKIDLPREMMPNVGAIRGAIEKALKKPRTINYLTFSGNGEPTLHPDFPEIVQGTRELVNHFRPDAKIALFSNASLINKPTVVEALRLIDLPMLKLDAGDIETFQAINQPASSVNFDEIVHLLKLVPSLNIQSMLIDGAVNNISGDSYSQWMDTLAALKPDAVHIYSIERPTACELIKPVPRKRLRDIKEHLQNELGLNVKAYWRDYE